MPIDITCKTDRFNLSVIGEDFINDCCFGEDFSEWLVEQLNGKGLRADVICMEDFGWANQVTLNEQVYILCIAGNSDDLPDNPNYGEWHVMLEKKRKLKEIILGRNRDNKDEPIYSILKEILILDTLKLVPLTKILGVTLDWLLEADDSTLPNQLNRRKNIRAMSLVKTLTTTLDDDLLTESQIALLSDMVIEFRELNKSFDS